MCVSPSPGCFEHPGDSACDESVQAYLGHGRAQLGSRFHAHRDPAAARLEAIARPGVHHRLDLAAVHADVFERAVVELVEDEDSRSLGSADPLSRPSASHAIRKAAVK